MSILYTHRGFPIDVVTDVDSIYESPAVTLVWQSYRNPSKPNASEDLMNIATLRNEWEIQGGLFRALTNPRIRIGGAVQSFLAETALLLTERITRRAVGFNDWAMMLVQAPGAMTYPVSFTADEKSSIEFLNSLDQNLLFARWLQQTNGLADLVETMQLFVGTRDAFAR